MAKNRPIAVIEDGKVYVLQAGTPVYLKTADVCRLIGKSNQWIGQLTAQGTLLKSETPYNGMYELMPNLSAYIERLEEKASDESSDLSPEEKQLETERKKADVSFRKARALKAQLEVNELTGTMHRSEDVEALTTDLVFAVRSALMALPGRLAISVTTAASPAEAAAAIKKEVDAILNELSQYKYDGSKYVERVRERTSLGAPNEQDDED